MEIRVLVSIFLAAGLSQAASAQNAPNADQVPSGAQSSRNTFQSQGQNASQSQDISQFVRDELAKLGYSDVKLMPDSVIVTAKKEGRNVVMWLQPHTLTELTIEAPDDDGI